MNVLDLYHQQVKSLSPSDRLRLATLILSDLTAVIATDESPEWLPQDYADFTGGNWAHWNTSAGPDDA